MSFWLDITSSNVSPPPGTVLPSLGNSVYMVEKSFLGLLLLDLSGTKERLFLLGFAAVFYRSEVVGMFFSGVSSVRW